MNIALVCIAKNEDLYIHEWIKYHTKLGFNKIFVYENNWRYTLQEAFDYSNVEFIPFDGEVMQLNAYNSFIKDHGNEFDWAAFIDVDEFFVINGSRKLEEILESFSLIPQIGVNWRLMGSNGLHRHSCPTESVLKRFTRGDKSLNRHVKQFVNLSWMKSHRFPFPTFINPHCTNCGSFDLEGRLFFGPFQLNDLDKQQELELYHYAVKTPEELHQKVMRGRADTTVTRVDEEEEYFKEHDKNDIELLAAKNFWLS